MDDSVGGATNKFQVSMLNFDQQFTSSENFYLTSNKQQHEPKFKQPNIKHLNGMGKKYLKILKLISLKFFFLFRKKNHFKNKFKKFI